jgi:hypothetical protein
MRIKFNYYINGLGKYDVCAAYFKAGKWRIYNDGAHYSVKNSKEANNLLQEVAEEMHVVIKNIKLVKATHVYFKEIRRKS